MIKFLVICGIFTASLAFQTTSLRSHTSRASLAAKNKNIENIAILGLAGILVLLPDMNAAVAQGDLDEVTSGLVIKPVQTVSTSISKNKPVVTSSRPERDIDEGESTSRAALFKKERENQNQQKKKTKSEKRQDLCESLGRGC